MELVSIALAQDYGRSHLHYEEYRGHDHSEPHRKNKVAEDYDAGNNRGRHKIDHVLIFPQKGNMPMFSEHIHYLPEEASVPPVKDIDAGHDCNCCENRNGKHTHQGA